MMNLFRARGLSSIVYGVIIVATIFVFVIQFRPNSNQKTASINQECVATVKGWCVDPKDHRAAYRILIPRDRQGNLLTARARAMGLLRIALDGLIERELLVSEAERLGIAVTEDEITDEIYAGFIHVSVPTDKPNLGESMGIGDGRIYVGFRDQKTKAFDVKVYERTIRNLMGRSPTEFREEQGRELLAQKMRDLVRAPVRVSDADALQAYIQEKSSATVAYVPVKQSYVTRYAVDVTDAEIAKWLSEAANQKQVDDLLEQRKADAKPQTNHVRHILIKVSPNADAQAKALALGRLASAAARIKKGEAFADVARETSEDPGSATRGGDVGDKTDGFVLPFKKAADALKPGEMTPGAVETQFGYHLIAKDDPAKAADVEAALKKDAARELVSKGKALDATKELATKIQTAIKQGTKPEDAITAAIAGFGAKKAAPAGAGAKTAAFVVLPAPGEEQAAGGADAGARGTTTTTAATAPSAKGDAGAGSAASAPAAVTPAEITAQNDPDRPQLQTSGSFNPGGDPIESLSPDQSQRVVAFAFKAKDGDLMSEPIRTDDGFLVVQLKDHREATKEEFDKDRDAYVQGILVRKQADTLGLYMKRLRDAAKDEIKIDERYLTEQQHGGKDGGAPSDFDEEEEP